MENKEIVKMFLDMKDAIESTNCLIQLRELDTKSMKDDTFRTIKRGSIIQRMAKDIPADCTPDTEDRLMIFEITRSTEWTTIPLEVFEYIEVFNRKNTKHKLKIMAAFIGFDIDFIPIAGIRVLPEKIS